MGAPIDDQRRAGILAALRANQAGHEVRSRADIARQYGVAPSTVRNIATAAGIDRPFDTTTTRAATVAARDHLRERRARLARRMLDEAEQLLDQLHRPHLVFSFGGKENEYNEHRLEHPPTGDIRNLMTSAAVAIDKHVVLDRHDTGDDADEAISMLGKLAAGLDHIHRTTSATEQGEP